MRNLLLALCLAPLVAGTAVAAGPLTDRQMDNVAAGFDIFVPGIEPIGPSAPAQPPLTGREICSACFPSAVVQFPSGVNPLQFVGTSRLLP
jgi:hypothetical protein